MSKATAILDLLWQGIADHHIAARVGVAESYVRAVRSRYSAPDVETFSRRFKNARTKVCRVNFVPMMLPPSAPRSRRERPQPTGQPREELRDLAQLLYRRREAAREQEEYDE